MQNPYETPKDVPPDVNSADRLEQSRPSKGAAFALVLLTQTMLLLVFNNLALTGVFVPRSIDVNLTVKLLFTNGFAIPTVVSLPVHLLLVRLMDRIVVLFMLAEFSFVAIIVALGYLRIKFVFMA